MGNFVTGRSERKIYAQVYEMAKRVTGWDWGRLNTELGLGGDPSMPNYHRVASNKLRVGSRISYEQFMVCCRLAKIPLLIGDVLWAKAHIPDDYSERRKNVGLTYKGIKEQSWKNTPDYVREFCKDEVAFGAKIVPDDPAEIRPGMILKPSRTRY